MPVFHTGNDFPVLFAAQEFAALKNTLRDTDLDKRSPAASGKVIADLRAPGGWAAFQNAAGNSGVGLYWENRNESIRAPQIRDHCLIIPYGSPS